MNVKDVELAKTWYLNGQFVPFIDSPAFGAFAAKGIGLMLETLKNEGYSLTPPKYSLDAEAPAAYFDIDKNKVAIPGWYVLKDRIKAIAHTADDLNIISVILINGSTIHESLHRAHTRYSMQAMLDGAKKYFGDVVAKYGPGLFADVINILEDVRIESLLNKASLKFWINAKNNVLFNDDEVSHVFERFNGAVETAIPVAICYKREELRPVVERAFAKYPQAIAALSGVVGSKDNTFNLLTNAAKFLTAFEAPDFPSEASGAGDPFEGASIQISGSELKKSLSSKEKRNAKAIASEFKNASGKISKENAEIASREKIDRAVSKIESKKVAVVDVESFVREGDFSDTKVQVRGSDRFAQLLKQLRTEVIGHGRAKKTGAKVNAVNLYRVATDGKIFSAKGGREIGNEVEIVILVDASGSMAAAREVGYLVEGSRASLFSICTAVAKKAFYALKNADVPCKVFAHTGDRETSSSPVLIKVASHRMGNETTSNVERKFNAMLSIPLNNNYDGKILKEILNGGYFSETAQKVLIVLSDGEPLGNYYHGAAAVAHTKAAVHDCRKAGISVVCLSLTKEVIEANNAIYGEAANIDASENVDKALTQMVAAIAAGGQMI